MQDLRILEPETGQRTVQQKLNRKVRADKNHQKFTQGLKGSYLRTAWKTADT